MSESSPVSAADPASKPTGLPRAFSMAAQPYINVVLSYQLRDGVAGENLFSLENWGLVHHDLSPKLAYAKVAQEWQCLNTGLC